jgi:glucose-1-phosphate thymidylyltransferase
VKVIIPLAGKGTRLRPHTHITPKPLVRVGGKPVMSYILDDLEKLGVREIVFITGYLKETIEAYIATSYPSFRARFVEQPVQDGTAGAVRLAEPFVDEDCLIIFVDTLFDADLTMVNRLPADEAGVIWAKEVEDYQRFGVIVKDEQGHMRRIVEKPKEPISRLANIGLYYIRDWKLLFEGIRHVMTRAPGPSGEFYLTDAFQYMIDEGARIRVAEVEGWYDCGQMETLIETNRHVLEHGRALAPADLPGVTIVPPVRVSPNVILEDAVIGPNVTIEAGSDIRGSTLRDCIIGRNVTLRGATLRDSMIGDFASVHDIDGSVNIGDHSVVRGED